MVTLEMVRAMVLALPETEEGMSWDAVSFKVNGKVIPIGASPGCSVSLVPIEERLPDQKSIPRPSPPTITGLHGLVLTRGQAARSRLGPSHIERVWRAQAKSARVRPMTRRGGQRTGNRFRGLVLKHRARLRFRNARKPPPSGRIARRSAQCRTSSDHPPDRGACADHRGAAAAPRGGRLGIGGGWRRHHDHRGAATALSGS